MSDMENMAEFVSGLAFDLTQGTLNRNAEKLRNEVHAHVTAILVATSSYGLAQPVVLAEIIEALEDAIEVAFSDPEPKTDPNVQ